MATTNRTTELRPLTRWTDDILKVVGNRWMRMAEDYSEWHSREEASFQVGIYYFW